MLHKKIFGTVSVKHKYESVNENEFFDLKKKYKQK